MRKRTTLNIDAELLAEAQRTIGTTGATDTIHWALREIVNARRRQWLLDYDFPGLTPESLEEMRRDREFAEDDESRSA